MTCNWLVAGPNSKFLGSLGSH
uniref:Uncharacterized protein n=1 Tax=Anguilla anguilla TaxID=7936 RepID=A0A0E9U4I8_ANGAN